MFRVLFRLLSKNLEKKSKLENFSSAVELAAFSFSSSSFGSSSKAAVTALTICSHIHALSFMLFMFFFMEFTQRLRCFPTDVSVDSSWDSKMISPISFLRSPAASLVPRSFRSRASAKPDMSSLAQLSMPQVLQPKDHPGYRDPPRYMIVKHNQSESYKKTEYGVVSN